jgi:superfamily II DNA or RNA helicase
MHNAPYGRDRRRRPTTEERQSIYARANGLCEDCGAELGADWHDAHMAAWIHGGATQIGTVRAQCPGCNLHFGPNTMEQVEGFKPRLWQHLAFPRILLRLWQTGSATLHAAPGAGKTLFAAAVFRHLYDQGVVRRIVIFVPNTNLVRQTVKAYGRLGIHLDDRPRDNTIEHPETVGLVVCYQSLSESAVRAHITRMLAAETLIVFDEVHHLLDTEDGTWGKYVATMVGDVSAGHPENAAAVLNMTGTLFRSAPSQTISTIRYSRVAEDKLEAIADYSVTTAELVGTELRAPDLYIYGAKATLIDLEEQDIIEGQIADLSVRQRSAVAREMFRLPRWLRAYCQEGLRMLTAQRETLNREVPLKLLHLADDQDTAARTCDIYNELAGYDIAVPAYTNEPGSDKRLEAVVDDPRPRVIVTCQMVTEGFDCHELSVLVHATRKTATLFIAQVMARVMRVTDYERASGMMLPAQILIPDSPLLRNAYAVAIAAANHLVQEDTTARCHKGHPKVTCPCQHPAAGCICGTYPPPPRLRRYEVLTVDDPRLDGATVLGHEDGHVPVLELEHYIRECKTLAIPEPFAVRVAVIARRGHPAFRKYAKPEPEPEPEPVPANPRDLSDTYRARLQKAAGFMEKHIGHDSRYRSVGEFQGRVNDAGSIPAGGRDLASLRQLATASDWACLQVRQHCEDRGEMIPLWARGQL